MFYNNPNTANGEGRVRRSHLKTISAVALKSAEINLSDVDLNRYGDLINLEVKVTGKLDGTLTNPKSLLHAINEFVIRDPSHRPIVDGVRGKDLQMLSRMLGLGKNLTVPTFTNDFQTYTCHLPINIEAIDLPAKLIMNTASLSELADGATGGEITVEISASYQDKSHMQHTQAITRIEQEVGVGKRFFEKNLPPSQDIYGLLFKVEDHTKVNDVTFTVDGRLEIESTPLNYFETMDNNRLVDGHVTGEYSLYVSPFRANGNTKLVVSGKGTTNIDWFLLGKK